MKLLRKLKQQPRFVHIAFIIIATLIVTRIAALPFVPPGFYVDEAASGAHVISMLERGGVNATNQAWPLFSRSIDNGFTTPIYLYPLIAWGAIFGTSETALRYFSEVITLFTIALVALASYYWFGKRGMLIAAIVGLALPWNWVQGSMAWDPVMVPLFVAASFLSFSVLLHSSSRKLKIAATAGLPVALVALAYVYAPTRVTAPLLYLLFYGILWKKKSLSLRTILFSALGSFVLLIPLGLFLLQPEALDRSNTLSVFYEASIFEGIGKLVVNFLGLLNPVFLFVTGDPNLRHSTFFEGMLGTASLIPLIALIIHAIKHRHVRFTPLKNKIHLLFLICFLGIIFGFLGSALTTEGQPHSLRSTAAWPFFVFILTAGWYGILQLRRRIIRYLSIAAFGIGTIIYIWHFWFIYPTNAAEFFDVQKQQDFVSGKLTDYDPIVIYYFQNK